MNARHFLFIHIMAAAAMLAGCHTAKNASGSAYDLRPENKQPTLERPAWPNYDLHDDRSFAAFSHIQTAPEGQRMRYLQCENGDFMHGCYTLYRCKDATYLCYDWKVPASQDWFFFRFTTGSAIIDADTGDRYLLQRLEHFPMDQCFWIYGQSAETIRLVQVYPALPLTVKHIQIYEASAESRRWMDGTGVLTKPASIDDLRPHGNKGQTAKPQKQGRLFY
jgi:hypothetical protein